MLDTIKNLFGFGPKVDYAELVKQGAIILDVRSAGEFSGGHIKGAINISVDSLEKKPGQTQRQKQADYYVLCIGNA